MLARPAAAGAPDPHEVRPSMKLPRSILASFLFAATVQAAPAPRYHLTRIEIPGANGVYVADVNDAGQAVGYYVDANYENHAFLYENGTVTTLAQPPGRDEATAAAINNRGQIVGYASTLTDDGALVTALLWNAADPAAYTVIGDDPANKLNPSDINDAGVVAGLASRGGAFSAFTWSEAGGLVDDGVPPHGPGTQAYWSALNNDGVLVGGWNFPQDTAHATTGRVGVSGIGPLAAGVDDVASMAHAINDAGVAVGEMDLDGSGSVVPVTFADGVAQAVPGALLGLGSGGAYGINASGAIVGRAQDFSTMTFKAFVAVDGAAYDLLAQSDGDAGFAYLLKAAAINAQGTIVGSGRIGTIEVGSFVATPLAGDAIFADGFDAAAR
jgi:probable HAF family extracellular repeat protein